METVRTNSVGPAHVTIGKNSCVAYVDKQKVDDRPIFRFSTRCSCITVDIQRGRNRRWELPNITRDSAIAERPRCRVRY